MDSFLFNLGNYVEPNIYYSTLYPSLPPNLKKQHWKKMNQADSGIDQLDQETTVKTNTKTVKTTLKLKMSDVCHYKLEDIQMIFNNISNEEIIDLLEYICYYGYENKLKFICYYAEIELSKISEFKLIRYLCAHHNKKMIIYFQQFFNISIDSFSQNKIVSILLQLIKYKNIDCIHIFIDNAVMLDTTQLIILIRHTLLFNQYKIFKFLIDLLLDEGDTQLYSTQNKAPVSKSIEKISSIIETIIQTDNLSFFDYMLKHHNLKTMAMVQCLFMTASIIEHIKSINMIELLIEKCRITKIEPNIVLLLVKESIKANKLFAVKFFIKYDEKCIIPTTCILYSRRKGFKEMTDYLLYHASIQMQLKTKNK
jgi:hypothetical protein